MVISTLIQVTVSEFTTTAITTTRTAITNTATTLPATIATHAAVFRRPLSLPSTTASDNSLDESVYSSKVLLRNPSDKDCTTQNRSNDNYGSGATPIPACASISPRSCTTVKTIRSTASKGLRSIASQHSLDRFARTVKYLDVVDQWMQR